MGLAYSTIETISGPNLPELDLIAIATQQSPYKSCHVLKNWMIIDIIGTEQELKEIVPRGREPTIVYVSSTGDEADMPRKHNGLCSDYQVSLVDFFFETNEEIYILTGKGYRTTASVGLVSLLRNTQPAEQSLPDSDGGTNFI